MKKVFLIAACLFMTTTIIKAQDNTTPVNAEKTTNKKGSPKLTVDQRAQKSVDSLDVEVGLNADQKTKVFALATTRITKADAVRAKYKNQPENKEIAKSEIKVIKQEYRKAVKAILTPEQLEKLKAKNQAQKAAGKTNGLDTND